MFGFLIGVAVGAAGFWAYRFWKGEDDSSWDQSFSSGTGSNSFASDYSSQPVGGGSSMNSGTPGGSSSDTGSVGSTSGGSGGGASSH